MSDKSYGMRIGRVFYVNLIDYDERGVKRA